MLITLRRTVFVCLAICTAICWAQTGKVEPLPANADSAVSDAVKKVLESKGHRVLLDDGSPVCSIWFRQEVKAQATKDVPGALYPQLAESEFIGVVSFPQATMDYRGEAIKSGTYTLRYGLLPNDGAHLGVTPNRDFLLLVPAGSDPDPDAMFKTHQLMALSRKSTGVQHPGPLGLVQAEGGASPTVTRDEEDHWVLSATIKLSSGGQLPLAVVVKGTVPQ